MEENNITENKTEYIHTVVHKQIALNQLDSLLTYHIDNNNLKKANLLSYWFEDFAKYNLIDAKIKELFLK